MPSRLDPLLSIASSSLLQDGDVGAVKPATLGDLRTSKAAVYDFWTTRCTNCPAALDRLDAMARQRPSVAFVGINIDDADAARELIAKAASEGRWTSLIHGHLEEDDKEKAKDILGMRTVPFYVVVGQDGEVLRHGNAKALPLLSLKALDSALLPGQQKENTPAVANSSPVPENHAASAPAGPATACEGGVCKLVRRKKTTATTTTTTPVTPAEESSTGKTAAAASSTPAAAASSADTGAAGGAAGGAAAPALECEGGVCKLVRKKKTPGETSMDTTVVAAVSGSIPAAGAAAVPRSTMECEGGVCKLVRKNKKEEKKKDEASEHVAAAGEAMPQEEKRGQAAEEEGSLGIGDMMPSLRVVQLDGGATSTLDDIRAGGRAVLDFWTTRCVRCPAALDELEALAAAAAGDSGITYVSVNLDSLEGARGMVSEGRWPSLSHVFAGRDEDSEALESLKTRAGLKSVPFYFVLAGSGRIEQIGGPKVVKLKPAESSVLGSSSGGGDSVEASAVAKADTRAVVDPAPPAPEAPKTSSFTTDEDF